MNVTNSTMSGAVDPALVQDAIDEFTGEYVLTSLFLSLKLICSWLQHRMANVYFEIAATGSPFTQRIINPIYCFCSSPPIRHHPLFLFRDRIHMVKKISLRYPPISLRAISNACFIGSECGWVDWVAILVGKCLFFIFHMQVANKWYTLVSSSSVR